jgi:uncharacterized repeat protein (TIGR03803 family)
MKLTTIVCLAILLQYVPTLGAPKAATFSVLYSFSGRMDGDSPFSGLIKGHDGCFYGTTIEGGANDRGSIFKIMPEGALTTLYSFGKSNGTDPNSPTGSLVQAADGCLYGTTEGGGANNAGTIFKLTAAGKMATLYSFSDHDTRPNGLIQARDGCLYGTTTGADEKLQLGKDYGSVFRITPTGKFTTLHAFAGGPDGEDPESALVQGRDGFFYATTRNGGANGCGTVFKMARTGSLTIIHLFTLTEGYNPTAGLVEGRDGCFYGAAPIGGPKRTGKMTVLHWFGGDEGDTPSGLALGRDGCFYATTARGGASDAGVVFKMTPAGEITTLYSFGAQDGKLPSGLVQGNDGCFYATMFDAGVNHNGVVFKITPPEATGVY